MKKLLSVLCAAALLVGMLWVPAGAAAGGTTYYVSQKGSGAGTGTQAAPFPGLDRVPWAELQPGDQVLLERGSVFYGGLQLQNVRGTQASPIVIGAYGTGNAPRLDAKGQGIWLQTFGTDAKYMSAGVLLYDCDYVTVRDLEITNQADRQVARLNDMNKNPAEEDLPRAGVAVVAKEGGACEGIALTGLNVHDVVSEANTAQYGGGIYFAALTPTNASTGATKFAGVQVAQCQIARCSGTGINLAASAGSTLHTGAVVEENYLQECGILVQKAQGATVRNNVVDGADASSAALWECQTGKVLDNESFASGQDAWEVYGGSGNIFARNYGYGNGGFAHVGGAAAKSAFRYNLWVRTTGGLFNLEDGSATKIYNNDFYGVPTTVATSIGSGQIANNIFYGISSVTNVDWGSVTYTNNLYYNVNAADDSGKVEADPRFTGTMSAPSTTTGTALAHSDAKYNYFKLGSGSPAINGGTYITADLLDFYGTTVRGMVPDIGIHETNDISATEPAGVFSGEYIVDQNAHVISDVPWGTTVSEFKSNLTPAGGVTITAVKNGTTVLSDSTRMTHEMTLTLETSGENYTIVLMGRPVADYRDLDRTGWTVTAGSEQSGQAPNKAVDGDNTTLWHSSWNGCTRADVWLRVDLGATKEIARVSYLPRQSGGNNGKFREYEVYVSNNDTNWTKVAEGTWGDSDNYTDLQHATFNPVNARYVKIVGVSTAVAPGADADAGKIFGSCAEFYVGEPVYESLGEPVYRDLNRTGWTATAGSVQSGQEAAKALDGDNTTLWHSSWNGCTRAEVWFRVDMGALKRIARVSYLPRREGGNNGKFRGYEVYVSTDDTAWTKVAQGTWGDSDNYTDLQHATFDPVNARYVKIVGTSTAVAPGADATAGKIFGTCAEFYVAEIVGDSDPTEGYMNLDRTGWTASAGSTETAQATSTEGDAAKALDGQNSTMWHSAYAGCTRAQVWLQVDMKEAKEIARVSYLPRQAGGPNGKFRGYEVQVSTDGTNWIKVAEGTWGDSDDYADLQHATFTPVTARYVKILGTSTAVAPGADATAGKIFGTCAEIYVAAPVHGS